MNTTVLTVISIIISAGVFGACYPLLRLVEKKAMTEEDYEGRITEDKFSPVRLIIMIVLGGVFAGLLASFFGFTLKSLLYLVFFLILTIIGITDFDTMEIPIYLNIAILVLGIASIWITPEITIVERLIGMVCIALPMFLLNLILGTAFGGGDVKLMFVTGILLGWKINAIGFFIGAVCGAIFGVASMIIAKKKGKSHIPFGPSLCIGLVASTLAGEAILNWYIGFVKSMMTIE